MLVPDEVNYMPVEDVRDAVIRLLNRFISQQQIDSALAFCGVNLHAGAEIELTIAEFRAVYRKYVLESYIAVLSTAVE